MSRDYYQRLDQPFSLEGHRSPSSPAEPGRSEPLPGMCSHTQARMSSFRI
jgi:hypothetical protein